MGLKDYLKRLFIRTEKSEDELTPTDKVILDYIKTKDSITRQLNKARQLEARLEKHVNKNGILQGKKYVYKQGKYTVEMAPRKEDLVRAGEWNSILQKGLVRKEVKTKRDYGKLEE